MMRVILTWLGVGLCGILLGVGLSALRARARRARWQQWQREEWEETLEAIDALKMKEE